MPYHARADSTAVYGLFTRLSWIHASYWTIAPSNNQVFVRHRWNGYSFLYKRDRRHLASQFLIVVKMTSEDLKVRYNFFCCLKLTF